MKYILALDQGTTSSRAVLFNRNGQPVATAQQEFTQYFPQPGWVEHDALEIWQSQKNVMQKVLQKARVSAAQIQSIGITNQRETSVVWDRRTGQPIAPAIVWQDRRTAGLCEKLKSQGSAAGIQKKTGLVLDAYFSATKIAWLLDHVKGARRLAEQGHLAFGTIDTWLIWQLTGGRVHVTDPSNASRTMLFNLHTQAWDASLLKQFNIPFSILPQVVPSSGVLAETDAHLLGVSVPISGLAGDQQAATFGQACFAPGMAKNTYGTGCFMLMNTGHVGRFKAAINCSPQWRGKAPKRLQRLGQAAYALGGSVFMAGATVLWLRDGLQIIQKASDVEALAASVPNTDDVYLVPAFAGLGAPDWDGQARGTLVGRTRGTTKAHIARAALEAIAWQVADVFMAMSKDSGLALTELRVDGGASQNNLLMQMQADALGVPVVRASVTETTALGAAYLAGLATGFWSGADEITAQWSIDRKFVPQTTARAIQARQSGHARWREAVSRSRSWAQD
jgi:glycerol kinase